MITLYDKWLQRRMFRWGKPIFWWFLILILVLALVPPLGAVTIPSTGWDKLNHAIAFFMLITLGMWAYSSSKWRLIISLILYGAIIEMLQWLTPYRQAEITDLLANVVGIALGYILVALIMIFSTINKKTILQS